MNRRSFFKIFPGMLAAKEIAAELAKPKPIKTGLYYQMLNGRTVPYEKLTQEKFKEVVTSLYNKPTERSVRVWTNQAGMEMFDKLLKEEESKLLWG
jgi:hypothetical protein